MRPIALLAALALASPALAVPLQLTHQGRLADSAGQALEGAHQLGVSIYADATGGSPLWTDTINANFDSGAFSIVLGAGATPLDSALFDGSVRYVELSVDGGAPLPDRLPVTSVPYAFRAGDADHAVTADALTEPLDYADLVNVPEDADSLAGLACGTGDVPTWDGSAWACASPTPAVVDVSTLTGTIDIDNLPVGTSGGSVAAGDHTHSFGQITGELGLDRTLGDLPLSRTTGDLPIDRTTGSVPYARLPVGTAANTVAAGNHTHDAAAITSGTLDAARLPGSLKLGDSSVSCGSSTRGQVKYTGDTLEICGPDGWSEVWRNRVDDGSAQDRPGASCKAILDTYGGSNGLYWVDPDDTGPISPLRVYCDMANGGWALVGNVTNRWARQVGPGPFFTRSVRQGVSSWTEDAGNSTAITPTTYGALKVDNWPKPASIRFQNVEVSSSVVKDQVTFTTTAAIDYLVASYALENDARNAGGAQGFSTAHNANRTYHYASDHEHTWHYWGGIMGRERKRNGWQFGLGVNKPDGVGAYNGVNDDSGRAEFNLGVGGDPQDDRDITGHWTGRCTSGCNEDWATALPANAARTMVWYQ